MSRIGRRRRVVYKGTFIRIIIIVSTSQNHDDNGFCLQNRHLKTIYTPRLIIARTFLFLLHLKIITIRLVRLISTRPKVERWIYRVYRNNNNNKELVGKLYISLREILSDSVITETIYNMSGVCKPTLCGNLFILNVDTISIGYRIIMRYRKTQLTFTLNTLNLKITKLPSVSRVISPVDIDPVERKKIVDVIDKFCAAKRNMYPLMSLSSGGFFSRCVMYSKFKDASENK